MNEQYRHRSIHVDKASNLKELCRYVVLNPVRAKMKEHPGQWKWSSYRATAGLEKAPQWLEVRWVLGQFGRNLKSAQKNYRAYVLRDMKVDAYSDAKRTVIPTETGQGFRTKAASHSDPKRTTLFGCLWHLV